MAKQHASHLPPGVGADEDSVQEGGDEGQAGRVSCRHLARNLGLEQNWTIWRQLGKIAGAGAVAIIDNIVFTGVFTIYRMFSGIPSSPCTFVYYCNFFRVPGTGAVPSPTPQADRRTPRSAPGGKRYKVDWLQL